MTTRIVIVGAGYGGMMAALRLAGRNKHQPLEIILINAEEMFVERLRLHEYAARGESILHPIRHLLRDTNVQFIRGWVTALDAEKRQVVVDQTQYIDYDYLIYALGSAVEQESVPGIREYAEVLNPRGGADQLRARLGALSQDEGRVLVVGGGATGIEGAAEIKALNPHWQVSIVTAGEFGTFKGQRVQKHLRQAMSAQDISVYEHKRVTEVREKHLVLDDGTQMPFDLCLWAGGFTAPLLAREAGLQVNKHGQILLDPYLRSLSHPEIYAIGDAGIPLHHTGAPYRMSTFVALVMGARVADNLTLLLRAKPQRPLGFSTYGQAIALGPRDAVGFATFPSDQTIGPIYRGMFAVRFREFFVRLQITFLELERRFPGFFFTVGRGRYKLETQPTHPARSVEDDTRKVAQS
jgi:NADH dehydrogenase FAD-containing subunit